MTNAEVPDTNVGDTISRKAAIETIMAFPNTPNGFSDTYDKAMIIRTLEDVPSVQPRMKGRWIKQVDESINAWWYECSACGDYPLKDAFGHDSLSQFCPWCGAEMSEGEEE